MRKYDWLLLIFILFTLSGCSQTESVRANAYGYHGVNLYSEDDTRITEETVLMKTYAEYQDFLTRMMQDSSSHDWFFAKLSSYSASYFQRNMLVFIGFEVGTTDYEIALRAVEYEAEVIQVKLQIWLESGGSTMVEHYGVIVELPQNWDSSSVEFSFSERRPEATRTGRNDRVLVTGISDVLDLSYAEIADKLNEAGDNYVSMKIIMNNTCSANYQSPAEYTKAEIQKLTAQYRDQVEGHFVTKNQEIMDAWDLTGIDAVFYIDSYMPWVYADFSSGITEKDVELIHELMKKNRQMIKVIILSPNAEAVELAEGNAKRAEEHQRMLVYVAIGGAIVVAAGGVIAWRVIRGKTRGV